MLNASHFLGAGALGNNEREHIIGQRISYLAGWPTLFLYDPRTINKRLPHPSRFSKGGCLEPVHVAKKSLQSLLCRRLLLGLRSRAMHPDVSPFLYVHDLALLAPVHLT